MKEYTNQTEILQHAIDYLKENKEFCASYGCDLHNDIFNTDYYIIGTYRAKEWLKDFTFEAIEIIREYEEDNFGEVNTDFSDPEKVVNMYVYIVGEHILYLSQHLSNCWDRHLTEEDIDVIIDELDG